MKIRKFDLYKENGKTLLVCESSSYYPLIDKFTDPESIYTFLTRELQVNRFAEEHVYMFALRQDGKLSGFFEISKGSSTASMIPIDGIFKRLVLTDATQFIIAHNHPSGNYYPSKSDEEVTKRIIKASELMQIPFVDHIITGNGFYSFREQNTDLFYFK